VTHLIAELQLAEALAATPSFRRQATIVRTGRRNAAPINASDGCVSLGTIAREWTRIGCVGFGGPPAHIALLRDLCVERRGWLSAREFEDAIAACNLLPGPASTQLSIRSGAGPPTPWSERSPERWSEPGWCWS
jgi:hypothetical protein